MYPLVAKKWTNQKSDLAIETAFQKEAYPENFINIGWPQAKWIHHLPTWPQGVDDIFGAKFIGKSSEDRNSIKSWNVK